MDRRGPPRRSRDRSGRVAPRGRDSDAVRYRVPLEPTGRRDDLGPRHLGRRRRRARRSAFCAKASCSTSPRPSAPRRSSGRPRPVTGCSSRTSRRSSIRSRPTTTVVRSSSARQVEVALGYSRQEWLEQPDIWVELLHPDDREPSSPRTTTTTRRGAPWSREYRLIASDGRPVWFRDVARLLRDEDGRRDVHWLGVQLDITELKRLESELRASRDELERRVQERTLGARGGERVDVARDRRASAGRARAAGHRASLPRCSPSRSPRSPTSGWSPRSRTTAYYTSPRIEELLGYTVEEWHREGRLLDVADASRRP